MFLIVSQPVNSSSVERTPRSPAERHIFHCHVFFIFHHPPHRGAAHNISAILAYLALHIITLEFTSSSLHARSTPRLQHRNSSSGNLDDLLQMIGSCEIKVSDTFPSKMGADIIQELRDDAVVGRGDGANRVMVVSLRWHVITELKGGECRHLWHGLR